MGVGSSKSKKPEEKPIKPEDLKILLKISKEKCILYIEKTNSNIDKKKNEISTCLEQNNIDMARAKMNNILKDENDIEIYDLLKPFLEKLMERCTLIVSNTECPPEIKSILDTILFASTRVEIDELKTFKEKIIKKYGSDYVTNAEKNKDNSVNKDLLEKIQHNIYEEDFLDFRLKILCHERNIKCSFINDSIPDCELEPYSLNNKNPYESVILPTFETKDVNIEPDNKVLTQKLDDFPPTDIKESIKKDDKLDINSNKVLTQIISDVNGLFYKTKVIQKFYNHLDDPLELKIYVLKKEKIIFSSFHCQIGDSFKVKSKVIKEEKAKQKYVDSISSGNAAIFVSHDPEDENKIIINMGNLPPKTGIIFISNFISPIETSNNSFELEIFRNLPIFTGNEGKIYQNSKMDGEIIIKSNNEIVNISKNILFKNLIISEEKLLSKNPYTYTLKYNIDALPDFNWNDQEYIPSSKIYFDLKTNQPLALVQEKNEVLNEKYYYIQHLFKLEQLNKENQEMSPALFIFLLDQSGSMSGGSIQIAVKALILFLQSIPVGSYYQIIGFGTHFKKYDEVPKEYNKENIKESIKIIQNLSADLGGTNIYEPLKDIFDSKDYDNINLPRNIFLLTDGGVDNKQDVLNIIEANNSKFILYSIGIGNYFDEELIKNAGIIGKGNYNYCKDLNKLNSIISSVINKCCNPFITDININCNLDNKNLINNHIANIIQENELINLYYITTDNNTENNIKLKMKFKDNKNTQYEKNYEIIPELLEKGDDLSKLIIYNYIKNNNSLNYEEKIKLALKYQLFIEGTSLYAQVELDEKISSEMKQIVLGEDDQMIFFKRNKIEADYAFGGSDDIFGSIGNNYSNRDMMRQEDFTHEFGDDLMEISSCQCEKNENFDNYNINESIGNSDNKGKDELMEMIDTQDFIEGYWEENDKTKIIIEKYEKEFKLIKDLKNKNIDEKIAVTILIIYYIYKEHSNSSNDLVMVIKKAKKYIQKVTNDSYENIIKEINIK